MVIGTGLIYGPILIMMNDFYVKQSRLGASGHEHYDEYSYLTNNFWVVFKKYLKNVIP
jgi:hypothetical protein